MRIRLFCLVIFFVCLSPVASADVVKGKYGRHQNCKGPDYDYSGFYSSKLALYDGYVIFRDESGLYYGTCFEVRIWACPSSHPYPTGEYSDYGHPYCTNDSSDCDNVFTVEGGGTSCGQCPNGYIDAGEGIEPRCQLPESRDDCLEKGEMYDPDGFCVPECPGSSLNGECLEDPISDDECGPDRDDYRGQVVLGYGQPIVNICGDFDECSGSGGSVGIVNGELRCIPDDYGPALCESGSITVIDEYGFVCEPLKNTPSESEPDPDPNTDTDGDGVPDEYRRENDPTSVDKGLDKVRDAISDTNNKLDGTNQRLDKVGKALDSVNKNLGTANRTLGDILGQVSDINEKLDGPADGYSTDGLGDAPMFSETADRLRNVVFNNDTVQAFMTIPTIASGGQCPVWTIPATDFWHAIPLDVHCDILERHRSLLSAIFVVVWSVAAAFVFLRS